MLRGCLHIAAVVVFAIALFAVGCGGDDDATTSSSAPAGSSPSSNAESIPGNRADENTQATNVSAEKAEFIKQGNNLCTRTVARIQLEGKRIYSETTGAGNGSDFGPKLVKEVIVPRFEEEIAGLKQLEAPPGDQAQVNAVIAEIQKVVDRIEASPDKAIAYPYTQAEKVADRYGLNSCGRPALEEG